MPFLYSQGSTDGRKKLPNKRRIQSENCQTDKIETDFQNDKIEGRDSLIQGFFDERSRIRQKL